MATNNSINANSTTPLPVVDGGTQANTLTNHGVLLGQGTSAVVGTTALTNGQLLIGSTGADPVPASLTAGANIVLTPGAGSLTIAANATLLPWVDVATGTQTLAVNTGYITDNGAGLVTYTLPATAVQGSVVSVAGKSAGGWSIAQNAAQQINFGNLPTTAGVTGSLSSTNQWDQVSLLAVTGGASTVWVVLNAVGNLTVA